MNHIYRIVWNTATACYQAVSESATGQGKGQGKSTVVQGTASCTANDWALTATAIGAALCMLSLPSFAGPAGGQVTAGSATITQAGSATTINQTSNRAAIDWTKFSVGANESVRFNQPSASALTLNRVTGTESSAIMGRLSANGQVFILNPNGVLFGAGAQVNVGGLVASTLQINNANFMAGNYKFAGDATGSVVNHGHITVAPGGTLALMAPVVQNTGTLSAPGGSVLLAGAQAVTLTLQSNGGLVSYTLDAGSAQALVDNGGLIQAGGGHVVLTAKGIDALSKAVVNHSGVIEAQTVGSKNGVIELLGDMQSGTVSVSGKLDASAPNADGKGGDGGFIDTSAANVKIADTTRVTTAAAAGQTGMWLIDPTDFTINAGGGSLPPSSGIAASTLNANLSITNATIATSAAGTGNGDIFVNSPVDWSANKLTLTAHRNININANLNASGTAKLALNYGQASADGAGSDYILASGVQVNLPAGQNFSTKQGSAGAIKNYTVITTLGAEGSVTGVDLQGMNGNKNGYYVLGTDIDATPTLGWYSGAGFLPVGNNVNYFTGILDGLNHKINNIFINRPLQNFVGLFGATNQSVIRNIGMLGGSVSGANLVGGLVGDGNNGGGTISNTYSTLNISGNSRVGGLVGDANTGEINNSYATGGVYGSGNLVGGLIGVTGGKITNSYATGSVSGSSNVGGLLGYGQFGSISSSYATGAVSGTSSSAVGGLLGSSFYFTVASSFWDTQATGQSGTAGSNSTSSAGGNGKTTAQMQQQSTYTGWDFVNTWVMLPGNNYPTLRNNPVRVAVVTPDPAIEAARLAAIAAAAAAAAEADRLAAIEAARVTELARQAAIVAEQARLAEVIRLARGAAAEADRLAALATARVAELASQAEVARLVAVAAEQARLAEVARLAREAVAKAEADRVVAEAAKTSGISIIRCDNSSGCNGVRRNDYVTGAGSVSNDVTGGIGVYDPSIKTIYGYGVGVIENMWSQIFVEPGQKNADAMNIMLNAFDDPNKVGFWDRVAIVGTYVGNLTTNTLAAEMNAIPVTAAASLATNAAKSVWRENVDLAGDELNFDKVKAKELSDGVIDFAAFLMNGIEITKAGVSLFNANKNGILEGKLILTSAGKIDGRSVMGIYLKTVRTIKFDSAALAGDSLTMYQTAMSLVDHYGIE